MKPKLPNQLKSKYPSMSQICMRCHKKETTPSLLVSTNRKVEMPQHETTLENYIQNPYETEP